MSIRKMIEDSFEPTEPQDTMLAFFAEHEGKKVDRQLEVKLLERIPDRHIGIYPNYGKTYVEWDHWSGSGCETGGCLLLGYSDKDVHVSSQFIREQNPAFFAGIRMRNEARRHALERDGDIDRLQAALEETFAARAVIEDMTRYEGVFHVIKNEIEEIMQRGSYK